MLGSAGSAAAGSAGVGVESWDDAADAGADADADADADAGAVASGDEASDQGIPEPSAERWDAEGRFGAVGRPELQQHRSGASRFGRARREPFRPGS